MAGGKETPPDTRWRIGGGLKHSDITGHSSSSELVTVMAISA